ncbi:YggT family protein [Ignatzschineria sp. LJL83]
MTQILEFIIEMAYSFAIIFILLRFLLQLAKASFFHPIVQSIVKLTNPVILPIRKITPIIGSADWACILAAVIITILKYVLLMLIGVIHPISPLLLAGVVALEIARNIIYIYLFAFIIQAISSWVGSSPRQTVFMSLLSQLTNPLVKRFPFKLQAGVMDFRPMVIVLGLFLLLRVISHFYAKLVLFA